MTNEDRNGLKRTVTKYASRRRFLSGVAATGVIVGAGSVVYAQQGRTTSYRLDGITSGWVGLQPADIADTTNPTLQLVPGTEYEVTWVNSDGNPHNFAILDTNGETVLSSEIISDGTQTVTFTASEDMDQYLCEVHPNSMIGDLSIGSEGGTNSMNQTTQNQTAQNQTETPVDNENVSDLPDEPQPTGPLAEDSQKLIAQLEAKEGVETDATGTTYFTFYPEDSSVEANVLFTIYLDGLDDVTAAHIHLDRPEDDNPIVAPLYPTDDLVTSEVNEKFVGTGGSANGKAGEGTNATNDTAGMNGTNSTQGVPDDALPGTVLADSQLVAGDLTGPFEDADSLLPLVEAMNNDESFVQVHTEDNPGGAILGTITPLTETTQDGEDRDETTAESDNESEQPDDGDGKAKIGNGKPKTGNGKAKTGNGKRS